MTMTPIEVIEAYNYEVYHKKNYELGAQIIADKVIRRYPGKTVVLTREESLDRIKDVVENMYSSIEFTLPLLLQDGEYVTMVWNMKATPKADHPEARTTSSSIEIFRVVDGQITETWNPDYPQGSNEPWVL